MNNNNKFDDPKRLLNDNVQAVELKPDLNEDNTNIEIKINGIDEARNNYDLNNIENNQIESLKDIQDSSCFSCHDNFNPFDVELTMPEKVQAGEFFKYEIIITNTDTATPHTVKDLEAVLIGLGESVPEPYNAKLDGSVRRSQVANHVFPVESAASYITIALTGDAGIIGLNNLDLYLTTPNGQALQSNGAGVEEELSISGEEITKEGYGDYAIEVRYSNGIGPISYSINIEVLYSPPELVKFGKDLDLKETYTFSWSLALTSDQIQTLNSEVSGTVRYKHQNGEIKSYRYTFIVTPELIELKESKTSNNYILENGRIIGLLSLGILIIIMVNGFSAKSRKIMAKPLRLKNPQNVHCIFSLIIVIFTIIHASLLITGPYSWNSAPNIYGATALTIFGVIAVSGFYRGTIISRIGEKKWRRFHLSIAIIAILIILYHVLTFGKHFG